MRIRAGWLALSVLAVATLLMVFFVLPRISDEGQQLSDNINAAGETVKEAVAPTQATGDTAGKPSEGAATDMASAAPAAGAPNASEPSSAVPGARSGAAAGSVTPAFDVLRVEPNGSTVIAGRAEPDATVEVASGDNIVAAI